MIIALVLLQSEEGDGLGGLFSGGSNSAFGSRSASVVTKATYVVVGLFFVTAFFLAIINKTPGDKGIEAAALSEQGTAATEWWNSDTKTPSTSDVPAANAPAADAPVDAPAAQ